MQEAPEEYREMLTMILWPLFFPITAAFIVKYQRNSAKSKWNSDYSTGLMWLWHFGWYLFWSETQKMSKNAPLLQQPHQYSAHEGNHWLWLSAIITHRQTACAAADACTPTIGLDRTFKHSAHAVLRHWMKVMGEGLNLPALSEVLKLVFFGDEGVYSVALFLKYICVFSIWCFRRGGILASPD